MATGHVLWIAQGKKKKVVYDFIEHVGMDWMRHVDAVALDMNSDFEEAFLEKCPHIRPVFDYSIGIVNSFCVIFSVTYFCNAQRFIKPIPYNIFTICGDRLFSS